MSDQEDSIFSGIFRCFALLSFSTKKKNENDDNIKYRNIPEKS